MAVDLKEDLLICMKTFKKVLAKNLPEHKKIIGALENPNVHILNTKQNKQKLIEFFKITFDYMPELVTPENEVPLNKFLRKADIDTTPAKKPSKKK